MRLTNVLVNSNYMINNKDDIFKMDFYSEFLAGTCSPGQFVHLECAPGQAFLLRRPFSISNVDRKNELVSICYAVVGEGTSYLSKLTPGDNISIMGPLGTGFKVYPGLKAYVVGGGMGIAPLLYLSKELLENNNEVSVFLGAKSKFDLVLLQDFKELEGVSLNIATEDGSLGYEGLVTDLLKKELKGELEKELVIYSCGPNPMLKAVKKIAHNLDNEILCQLSLESKMACAVGACLGCAVDSSKAVNSTKDEFYLKVCKDGPVFSSDEVEL